MRDRGDILFYQYEWSDVVRNQKDNLRRQVEDMNGSQFDGKSIEQIADELVDRFSIDPPEIFPDDIKVSQREVDIEFRDSYGFDRGSRTVRGTAIDVRLPFKGDEHMFRVKPSTFDFNPPHGELRAGQILFTVSGTDLTPEKVRAEIDGIVRSILTYLDYQAKSIGAYPKEIRQLALQELEQRKAKLTADEDLVSKLGYKQS